ncbi:MAG TPA: DUF481 domain-containing protein [Steroidobacteraceae bacterium]|nr:DUF481 domain-containing protein [Steroidobacteraceae bacterium]
MRARTLCAVWGLLVAVNYAQAARAADAAGSSADTGPKYGTTITGQAGILAARGNTDTTAVNAKAEYIHNTRANTDDFEFEWLYSKSGDILDAERWATTLQHNWNIAAGFYLYVDVHYEDDLFSGFAYQASASPGVGYTILDNSKTKLSVQIGPAYQRLQPEILTKNPAGEVVQRTKLPEEDGIAADAKLKFEYNFNQSTRLTETLSTIASSLNTELDNSLALQVKMSNRLSLSLGYTVRYNSNPPVGTVTTDTQTTLNLVYTQKP